MGIANFFNFGKEDKDKFKDEEITKIDTTEVNRSATVITNSRAVLDYTVNVLQMNAFKEKKKIITQSCIAELTEYFGKHNTTFRGSEYTFKVWIVEFAGQKFDIFTANGYGTQIDVDLTHDQVSSGNYDDLLKAFSNKLYDIINL